MNYMKQIANMLGVELEEEFKTNEFDDYTFKLTEDGLRWKCDDSWKGQAGFFTLEDILCNRVEIIKKPKSILTEEEKEYLSYIIKPFKDNIESIYKDKYFYGSINDSECIEIKFYDGGTMCFPQFKKNTMYQGMELEKEYKLEDLEL